MNWDGFFVLTNLLKQAGLHWLFSAVAGVLEFLLIATIFSAAYRAWRGTALPNIRVRYSILGLALCCAFLAAFTAHCYLDGWVSWYTTPVNAPLMINTDPLRYNP